MALEFKAVAYTAILRGLRGFVGIVWLIPGFGATGMANAAATVTLGSMSFPRATITVDGATADWTGIAPLIDDPQESAQAGAQIPASQDITAVYVAADDDYVYWRIDLAGTYQISGIDMNAGPSINFDNAYGQNTPDITAARITARVWEWAALDDPSNFGIVFKWYGLSEVPGDQRPAGYGRIAGNVAEMRIPRSAFADINVHGVAAYYYTGNGQASDSTVDTQSPGSGDPPGTTTDPLPYAFAPVTTVTEVFSNAGTVASVVDGVVRIAAAPSTPLQLASGAIENAIVAFDTAAPVPVLSGTATLNYTRGGSDTALQIRSVAGSPALTPIAGSVDIAAPAAGSAIPVTGDSAGSARLVTTTANTQVTAGRDASRNLVVAVSAGPVTYTATTTRATRSATTLPSSFTVYPGEAVLADDSGSAGQVRLGSFAQDGAQAGDFIANLPRVASTLNVPRVAGASQRFGADWALLVGQAIATKLDLGTATSLTQDATSGVMTLVAATGTYRFLPVGTLALAAAALGDTSRAVSVADIAANLTAILDSSLSFAVAPATTYADLETALKSISSAASLEILGDGVIKASLSGTDFVAQPASQATDGSTAGCPGFVTENNLLALCDATGKRQVLNAAFADTDTLRSTFRTSMNLPTLAVTNTGANGAYAAQVGGTSYTLSPDLALTTPPASQAGQPWWQDAASGKIYIRYPNGAAQGFGLQ